MNKSAAPWQSRRITLLPLMVAITSIVLSADLAGPLLAQTSIQPVSRDGEIIGIAKFGRRAELTFGTAGQITSLNFDEGDKVQKGELLATLYDKTAESALAEAKQRASAVGPLLTAKAQLSAAKTRLTAVERANQNYSNAFSPQAVRDLLEAVEVASESVRQQSELIEIASAGEITAKSQLDSLRLVAPFDGTIVRKLKSVGEGVDAVSPVYELIDDCKVRIEFFVPENRLDVFTVGSPITIEAFDESGLNSDRISATVFFRDLSIQPVRRVVRAWTEIDRPNWIMDGTRLKIDAATGTQ